MRALKILLALIITTLGFGVLAGCPPTSDDDDSAEEGTTALCSGAGCENATECPADEPVDGDACDFNGNCHYCADGSTSANGYTCSGTSFTYVDVFTCE